MTKSLLGQEAGINVYPSVQWRKAVLEGWCLFSMEGHFKSSKIDQITLRIGWTLDNLICKSALISFLWFLCAAVWFERSWCDKSKLNHLWKSCENNGQHTKGSFKSRPKSVEKNDSLQRYCCVGTRWQYGVNQVWTASCHFLWRDHKAFKTSSSFGNFSWKHFPKVHLTPWRDSLTIYFYRSNLIFCIVRGCGSAYFGWSRSL